MIFLKADIMPAVFGCEDTKKSPVPKLNQRILYKIVICMCSPKQKCLSASAPYTGFVPLHFG